MNNKTVFHIIMLLLFALGGCSRLNVKQAYHQDMIQPTEAAQPDNIVPPTANLTRVVFEEPALPQVSAPQLSILEQVEITTNDFLDSVRRGINETVKNSSNVWYTNINLHKEIHCLAENIYYEAKGEPLEGKLAIANATVNRVKSILYPQSVCEVVWQPYQFSWTLHHRRRNKPHDKVSWTESQMIAQATLEGGHLNNLEDVTEGATNFYAPRKVRPRWRHDEDLQKTVRIGHHVFFRPKPSLLEARVQEPVVNIGR